jgi:hypothetical protein
VASRDEGHDKINKEDLSVSANLYPPVAGLIGIGVLACAVWALGLNDNLSGGEVLRCSLITQDAVRLACYDQLATPHEPAKGALAPLRTFSPEESK